MTTKKNTIKGVKEKDYVNPVNISEDVWFYPMPKRLEFTVKLQDRYVMFEISRKKLQKYITPITKVAKK